MFGTGSDTKPHWMRNFHMQYAEKLNVWTGIFQIRVVEQNLCEKQNLEFVQILLIPDLVNLFPQDNKKNQSITVIWF